MMFDLRPLLLGTLSRSIFEARPRLTFARIVQPGSRRIVQYLVADLAKRVVSVLREVDLDCANIHRSNSCNLLFVARMSYLELYDQSALA